MCCFVARQIILAGHSYDSKRLWASGRWDSVLPARRTLFLHRGWKPPHCPDSDKCIFSDSDSDSGGSDGSGSSRNGSGNSSGTDGADELLPRWLQRQPAWLRCTKTSLWYLSQHCTARSRLYHTLQHYKFRLLLKVR